MPLTCSDEEFAQAVRDSDSIADVVRRLGRAKAGASYHLIKREIVRLGIGTSHMTRRARGNKGRAQALPLAEVLVEHSPYPRGRLKSRLLREGLLSDFCADCGLDPQWNGKPLVLRLDHINGVRDDNRLANLRLVCPNCDSQSSTFCGRNQINRTSPKTKQKFCGCGKPIQPRSTACRTCVNRARPPKHRIEWPPEKELRARIEASSVSAVSRELGVSDKAVSKHLGLVRLRRA